MDISFCMLFYSCIESLVFLYIEENVERDAVHKALMSLLRQDAKGNE